MNLRIFGDPVIFQWGSLPVTETMLSSTAISLLLLAGAGLLRYLVIHRPEHWLAVLSVMAVESFDNLVLDITGQRHKLVATLAGSLCLFIGSCNLAGQLPGVHPATGSLATTSALAVIVLFSVPIAGIQANGWWGYVSHYFRPSPLLMP
ncbi:MAG: F0F1 ATP synthase subunit A, partial [Planctomycetales bacterium]|nr:F0F1 ATP synthase subunit A [Planctomycetales bacterium]